MKIGDLNATLPDGAKRPDKAVNVTGAKANRVIHFFEAANATDDSDDACTMGSCYETGTMEVDCIYPNGPNKERQFDCDLSAAKTADASHAGGAYPLCTGAPDHGSCQDWQSCCDKNYPGKSACMPGRCGN